MVTPLVTTAATTLCAQAQTKSCSSTRSTCA